MADLGGATAPAATGLNYTYTAFNLAKMNESFEGAITKDSVIYLNEDASQIATSQTTRDVCYTLPNGERCYWVHKSKLPASANTVAPILTLNSNIDELF